MRPPVLTALVLLAASAHAQSPFVEYLYDDGGGNVNTGPASTFDPDMLWGNVFERQPGGEVLTEIALAFGPTFPSLANGPVTLWVLDVDPVTLDPRLGAATRATAAVAPTVFGDTFTRVSIPPTPVGPAFFVGASARVRGGQDRPARLDTGSRADRSWLFYAPDIAAVVESLVLAPYGTRMDDATQVLIPGAFMIRGRGGPPPVRTQEDPGTEASARLLLPAASPSAAPVARVAITRAAAVRVDVLDALGRAVAVLHDGGLPVGEHRLRWDGRGVAPGVYLVRLQADGIRETARVVVAR